MKWRGTTMNAQKRLEKDSQYAHLDLDGDGDKKEPMKEAAKEAKKEKGDKDE